jgi:hypothetical protein
MATIVVSIDELTRLNPDDAEFLCADPENIVTPRHVRCERCVLRLLFRLLLDYRTTTTK